MANGQENLGRLYEAGLGVEQSYEKAAELYRQAADQGKTKAMIRLAQLYREGNNSETPVSP